jgi:hypothetical protein
MKNPIELNFRMNSANRIDTFDSIKEYTNINEISSKSLLANVFDQKTREFVFNDDFGIIRSKLSN